ncbi:hypothetical protein QBC44DRAFT_254356 [Cladorrhinum sp. PSN332]|nr:hypothetical protein QBC44DRAFT_254356 [Cladorrhinum sp. PSN332]
MLSLSFLLTFFSGQNSKIKFLLASFVNYLPYSIIAYFIDPKICLSGPPLALKAGISTVSAKFSGQPPRQCLSTLKLADPDFLPVVYKFEPASSYSGRLLASFIIPIRALNGSV